MAYISSSENRFYVGLETAYGAVAASQSLTRIPAVKLTTKQQRERTQRKDKSGSRTFLGAPAGIRKATSFQLNTYMAGWEDKTRGPGYGTLFQACLGAGPLLNAGTAVGSVASGNALTFAAPHGLVPGQAVAYGPELRFVTALVDDHTVQLSAPFSVAPAAGTTTSPTATYMPANELPSATIFDYWSPASAVQRVIAGAAVDELKVQVNGDFHEFQFSGPACDVIDDSSFEGGEGGLASFPAENLTDYDYSIVPGHLGQVWLGSAPQQFFTLTSATLTVSNNLDLRNREFGSNLARGISPGIRNVSLEFTIYQQDDAQTKALYQAARQDSPISVMIQLGQQGGQLAGLYLKSVLLETPQFDDSEQRQQWSFKSCRAQGTVDDEIAIAFG
ncbi:MAG TPA: phage tail tube protein [Bryobacteraceae bacterium]|nr:phage tail tube protein [Bryobacteraceae bacterium]